ncbi:MAG TPA: Asp-tRNA(Asn)/Glu-tRNA(Gln) amidotransferase subunit GatC [Cyclobacteriaceae bacterium]|nr:Asp-tRNA(Asn)/Glu-tRNA(Gln) amidotransferase subunit GatC [Cyclobacteriaceae bacterium]
MNIDRAALDKIAHLARLEFDEQDAQKMMDDMTAIVSWVEQLNEVPTDGVEPLTTMSHEINALRDDEVQPSLDRAEALRQAPQHDGQHFRVPKVLE